MLYGLKMRKRLTPPKIIWKRRAPFVRQKTEFVAGGSNVFCRGAYSQGQSPAGDAG